MMEPSAKRLRILQSVEVDETNPDYIAAKQKQQQKLKGRFESIFAKYEGMHESMSDEVDINTGQVVVDRGHVRRVQRQMLRKTTLLDNFLEPAFGQEDTPEEEEAHALSEDELAPTQVPSLKRKRDSPQDRNKGAQLSEQTAVEQARSAYRAASTLPTPSDAAQVPNTPNPAANLLQHVQFPQTPLGQQAQAAFLANLNQTIAQAVQQAVAPILSSVLQTTPNVHALQTHSFLGLSPQVPAIDSVRPATDPKWYFPPMSAAKDAPQADHQRSSPPVLHEIKAATADRPDVSSPLVPRRRSPKVQIQKRQGAVNEHSAPVLETSDERPQISHSLPTSRSKARSSQIAEPSVDETPKFKAKRGRAAKYHFTEEDDIYISKRRVLHKRSFGEIQASKEKWSDLPSNAVYYHWNRKLKGKQLHLRDTSTTEPVIHHDSPLPLDQEEQFFSSKEIPETSSASHRLPTPDSLEQDDDHITRADVPSSSHFDDDEIELLSLAGADVGELRSPHTHYDDDDDDDYPTPDEPLPSIEGAEFRNEDELQNEMLQAESPTPEPPKVLPSTIPETQESAVVVSSPSQKRLRIKTPKVKPVPTYRAATDASDDLNLIGADEEPATPHLLITIKRESLTPQASRFLCSSPAIKTPRCIPQSSGLAKSTGKLDRRAVKQSWTKMKGRASGGKRRRSSVLPLAAKKTRVDVEVEDSEDELAL
ncbi:hypothetical protein SLS59_001503 [Nothophoma quercina]|uniref:Uncharacterized protein n=1 Tax=Nothophoma quercina TaxID=749835 RepID=A0ABR3RXH8_9PLEO